MTARQTTDRMLAELRRAYQLAEEQRAPEALEICRTLLGEARQAGIDSAHLHWACAVAADYAGELEMAFEQITTAIAKDPLAPPFRHSFDLIARHLRAALGEGALPFAIPGPASA